MGVAVEHGQQVRYEHNNFLANRVDMQLWADAVQDKSWGYPKARDVRSVRNELIENIFGEPKSISIKDSIDTTSHLNLDAAKVNDAPRAMAYGEGAEYSGDLRPLLDLWLKTAYKGQPQDTGLFSENIHHNAADVKGVQIAVGKDPFIQAGGRRGRKTIVMDEWGPYDYRSPKLVLHRGVQSKGQLVFDVLGPKGRFSVKSVSGGALVGPSAGTVPGVVRVQIPNGKAVDLAVRLAYVGAETTDSWGRSTPAGRSVPFGFTKFFLRTDWTVDFFKWDKSSDPRTEPEAFAKVLAAPPIATENVPTLEFTRGGSWLKNVPPDYFALRAEADLALPAGDYRFDLTADNGARAFLDGKPIQLLDASEKPASAWKYQGATAYHATLHFDGKPHRLRVEYFQIDGGKALLVGFKPSVNH